MELGETNPQSAATEYRETRGQHNFYLAIQLVLAIITAIGVGIALCSLKDLNRSVIAANAQASAAITQANIAIAAGQARMVPTDHKASGLNISLYFLNAGISPAVNVYGLTEYALGSGMSIPTPQFAPDCAHLKSKQPAPTKISFPVVLPKDTFSIDPIQDIPAGWSAEANADEIQQFPVRIGPGAGRIVPTIRTLLIHGCVWYTDVLSNQERTTEFYFMANRNRPAGSSQDTVNVYPYNPFTPGGETPYFFH